jgi:serine/threonine protein kinase/WD40 repeat protein
MDNSPQLNTWQDKMLGRYHLHQLLGRGGMGEVWLAEDTQLLRKVAIKLLPAVLASDQNYLQDFQREAQTAASLDHPNILPVHDFGEQQTPDSLITTYLVMPYISGGTLRDRMRSQPGLLPTTEALHYLKQAAEAIDYAHSRNIIHRDIKTANMLLQNGWLFLADLGIAKLLNNASQRTRTHAGSGTPDYMAPEQIQGKAEFASDRYSLAIMAYFLFTGRLPFSGETPYAIMLKQISEQPINPRELNPQIPTGVESALVWGMSKNPAQRPPSCKVFVDALERGWNTPDTTQNDDPEATLLSPWGPRASKQLAQKQGANATPVLPTTSDHPTTEKQQNQYVAPAFSKAPFDSTTAPQTPREPAYPDPGDPVTGPHEDSLPQAGKLEQPKGAISRRQILAGGGTLAALAILGGAGVFAWEKTHAQPGITNHPVPTAIPGPRKLVAGTALASLTGHTASVAGVAWDPSGRYLATIAQDNHLMIWDLANVFKNTSGTIQLISTPMTNLKVSNASSPFNTQQSISWSTDGKNIIVVTGDIPIILYNAFVQDAKNQNYTDPSQNKDPFSPTLYYTVSWLPRSDIFMTVQNTYPNTKLQIQLWKQGQTKGPIKTLSYSKGLASDTRADIQYIEGSPDGRYIAAMTNYQNVIVWDRLSGQAIRELKQPDQPTGNNLIETQIVHWSPVNSNLLLSSDINFINVWDVQKNEILLTLKLDEPHLSGYIKPWGAAWSPNGNYIATVFARDPYIYVWDVRTDPASMQKLGKTRKQMLTFPKGHSPHNKAVNDIAWSPDGKYIADCSGDNTAVIWKVDAE